VWELSFQDIQEKEGSEELSVVNIGGKTKEEMKGIIYIGRVNVRKKLPESPFANPFKLSSNLSSERIKVVYDYFYHFYTKMKSESDFLEKVLALRGKTLGCWCKPYICHGDIIVNFLQATEGKLIEDIRELIDFRLSFLPLDISDFVSDLCKWS